MNWTKPSLAGFIAIFASPALAHEGAHAPHVHWGQAFEATPAHIAGLAIICALVVVGAYGLRRLSSRRDPTRRTRRPS